jgi:Protein of unknown function (DUF1573)
MLRLSLVATAALLMSAPAHAATWAEGMFEELARDFGSVPRGPMLTHQYRLTNNTGQTVRITSVRVSCGCTSATALQGVLAPGQSTAVLAQMDTTRFIGPKTVTIYVQFDQPQFAEVNLSISANSRTDIVVTPDTIAFGPVSRGSSAARQTTVTFTGGTQLVNVGAESNYVQLTAKGTRGNGYEATYEITATLRPDTPVGKWYTDVWLNTNNPATPRIRVPLTVDVEPALNLSPAQVAMGSVTVGDQAERRVIIRGPQPFHITEIKGTDDKVSVTAGDAKDARPVHVLTVKVKPGGTGDLSRNVTIVTDLKGDNTAELSVKATAAMPKSE